MPSASASAVEIVWLLVRPAIAEKPGDGDLERVGRALGVALEEPLGRVVAMGLGQTVRILSLRDASPVIQIEWHFQEGTITVILRVSIEFADLGLEFDLMCRSTK